MTYSYIETEKLLKCVKQSVSPYHCVHHAESELEKEGFIRLKNGDAWPIEKGGNYFCNIFGSALFAFHVPKNYVGGMPIQLAAAHTDWPGLRIKTLPEITQGRYEKMNIEVYGGPLFYTWLDRPLSIAGCVCLKRPDSYDPKVQLVDFHRPMAVIPSVAIHYNREANTNLSLNPQKDLLPLLDVALPEWKHDGYFSRLLAEEIGCDPDDILSFDMAFYNLEEPVLFGEHTEMLLSPRLDNLTAIQACISSIIDSKDCDAFCGIMLFDNEEIGSNTKQGADSVLVQKLLEKVILTLGGDHVEYLDSTMTGILLSCDVAHAIHPNHPELNDPTNVIYPGDGVTIKMTNSQRYATDVKGTALARDVCNKHNIPYKMFYNRADVRGGSTLGSMLSANLCIRTIDLGAPILAMHSSMELMATSDQTAMVEFMSKVLQRQ